jgi:hypothetical protein
MIRSFPMTSHIINRKRRVMKLGNSAKRGKERRQWRESKGRYSKRQRCKNKRRDNKERRNPEDGNN